MEKGSKRFGLFDLLLLAIICGSVAVLVFSMNTEKPKEAPQDFKEADILREESTPIRDQFERRVKEIKPEGK